MAFYKLKLYTAGALSVIVVALVGGGVLVMGARGFSARESPSALERLVARRVRAMATPTLAKDRTNPVPDSPNLLADALIGRTTAPAVMPTTAAATPRWASACIRPRRTCDSLRRSK
jgi:hypothetical protein